MMKTITLTVTRLEGDHVELMAIMGEGRRRIAGMDQWALKKGESLEIELEPLEVRVRFQTWKKERFDADGEVSELREGDHLGEDGGGEADTIGRGG